VLDAFVLLTIAPAPGIADILRVGLVVGGIAYPLVMRWPMYRFGLEVEVEGIRIGRFFRWQFIP